MSIAATSQAGRRYLKISEVAERTSLLRATIYRLIKRGDFPPGTQILSRRRGWLETAIEDWIEARETAR